MRSLRLLLLISCLAACRDSGSANGAVRVFVRYLSYTPACIRVTASDALGNSAETDIPRSTFKHPDAKELNVAVYRKPKWAQELNVEVASFTASSGDSCSGTVLERHASLEPIPVTPGEVTPHEVNLQARDDDGDGHVLKTVDVAGTDCVDSNRDIHPGAAEVCSGTEDFDCDGLKGCDDSNCLDAACDDNNPCTEDDVCTRGSGSGLLCQGTPKRCEPPNLTCYTNESACDPITGGCMYTQRPANTTCNDNNPCTTASQCGVDAACHGTSTVQCNSPPGQCYQSAGSCRVADGECDYPFKASTAACNDSNACTTNDTCNGSGGCAGAPLPPCTQPTDVCRKSERFDCPGSAACTERVDDAKVNTPCTVGQRSGVCRLGDGACSSFPYVPSNFDPDNIAATGMGIDLHLSCGSVTNPVVCNSSGFTPGCTAPAGCTLPELTGVRLISQGGMETLVVPLRSFIMDPGTAVKLKGTRPVILAVFGNATISGALLADADMEVAGAGGNRGTCAPSQKGQDGQFASGEGSGGGGGGFGTAGGMGGRNDSGQISNGGSALSSTLAPLVGGCQGGLGGGSGSGGAGGGGGGALQLSVAGTLRVTGTLSVRGGGGKGGSPTTSGSSNNEGGGGGGGSGGGLLLEAFRLELANGARLTANGGAGAEGGDAQNHRGSDGGDGRQELKDPATNPDNGGNGGRGGSGAAEGVAAASGGGAPNDAGGGGGGGGVGVIRLKGFGSCAIDATCVTSDNAGCDLSPHVTPICPP
jgi:hypothetical protein